LAGGRRQRQRKRQRHQRRLLLILLILLLLILLLLILPSAEPLALSRELPLPPFDQTVRGAATASASAVAAGSAAASSSAAAAVFLPFAMRQLPHHPATTTDDLRIAGRIIDSNTALAE
jgi:ABC-type sulfate transport system permease component